MIRAALLACSAAAAVRINCTVAVPRRIRAGDRVAARVDVAVAGAAAESLVVELRRAGRSPSAPVRRASIRRATLVMMMSSTPCAASGGAAGSCASARGGGAPCGRSSPLNGQIPAGATARRPAAPKGRGPDGEDLARARGARRRDGHVRGAGLRRRRGAARPRTASRQ